MVVLSREDQHFTEVQQLTNFFGLNPNLEFDFSDLRSNSLSLFFRQETLLTFVRLVCLLLYQLLHHNKVTRTLTVNTEAKPQLPKPAQTITDAMAHPKQCKPDKPARLTIKSDFPVCLDVRGTMTNSKIVLHHLTLPYPQKTKSNVTLSGSNL